MARASIEMPALQAAESADLEPHLVLRPRPGWQPIDLAELWHFRDLLWFLAVRDIRLRYKQTVLGAAWALLQPLMAMIVFSVFFGRLAKLPSDGAPYPAFAYCALLPWQLFAHALTMSSNSLVDNEKLITKVYFPRLLIPLSSILACLLDFAVAFVLLLVLLFVYDIRPHIWALPLLPVLVLFVVAAALSVGLWLSAMNAMYRDFRYTVPFIVQVWMFLSPVAYSSTLVPERWRFVYGLNPMAGAIDLFRWALLGQSAPPWTTLCASSVAVVVLLVGGAFYFRRMERSLADFV